jgi:glucosyl-dolichyl phosphate glucuronosyltransferase
METLTTIVIHRVSVIICAYTEERWDDLVRSVSSAAATLIDDDELIVVIDHNAALLARAQREIGDFGRPALQIVASTGKKGLSGARNSGIACATGDIVAFVDDDAAVHPGWRDALTGHYADAAVAVVGGSAQPVWPNQRPRWLPGEYDWIVGCAYVGLPKTVQPVRNVMGCNMSFRREILPVVGGFNTDLGRVGRHPVGCEETEFCIRISQRWPSKMILFDPDLRVSHYVSADRTKLAYFVRRCFGEGISKRHISRLVGSRDATSTERSYLTITVPRALLRGVREGFSPRARRLTPGGLARSAVLVLGVGAAGAGSVYAVARERRH